MLFGTKTRINISASPYSRGKDGRYDLARIGREVAGADLIALQEVERHRPRSALRDQPAELGESLGAYYWVYDPSFDMDASATAVDGKVTNRRRQLAFLLAAQDRAVAKQAPGADRATFAATTGRRAL